MTNVPNDETGEETEGTYNPSGGIPSHPADPGYEDDVDVSDDEGNDDE